MTEQTQLAGLSWPSAGPDDELAARERDAVGDPGRLEALRLLKLLDSAAEPPFDRLTRLASRMLCAPVALVSLVDSDRQFFKSCHGLPEPWCSSRQTPLSHSFCQHVVRHGKPLVIPDARCDPMVCDNLAIPELGVVAYIGVPLTSGSGHVLGSFCAIDNRPRSWSRDDLETLSDLTASVMTEIELRQEIDVRRRTEDELRRSQAQVAEQLRIANALNAALQNQQLELARANTQLAQIAITDVLTGLKNRRHFAEVLQDSYSLGLRRGTSLSVILADVDKFKSYNDTFGHSAGDDVLRTVAEVFREHTRNSDLVARYGGEEFVILLHETDAVAATEVANRLRMALKNHGWPLRPVTASFGVATLTPCCVNPWHLIDQADAALYNAKRGGRNRVCHYLTQA